MVWLIVAAAALGGAAADVIPCERLPSLSLPDAEASWRGDAGSARRLGDPGIAPRYVINYWQRMRSTVGESAGESARLFMVPGMEHCGGGNGTSALDLLGTIDRWVETGSAPARIGAARLTNGVVDRTRPLCPYPQMATYSGSGSIAAAANFSCR